MQKRQTHFFVLGSGSDDEKLSIAAEVLRSGGLVVFPTETVYGLGANALLPESVEDIYKAKGRPQDNPLIVHLADRGMIGEYAHIDALSERLIARFMPGPFTLILPSKGVIPKRISAGLETIAFRVPDHEAASRLLALAGCPVAAPSANLSGRPSPTTAAHAFSDMDGKVDVVLDGGSAGIGIESTVARVSGGDVEILRPGAVTFEDIASTAGEEHVIKRYDMRSETDIPPSPGMKYRHYAPEAPMRLIKGSGKAFADYINSPHDINGKIGVICFDEDVVGTGAKDQAIIKRIGTRGDIETQCSRLYAVLRELDSDKVDIIYARFPDETGIGNALCNRMIKAAGGKIIEV